MSIFGSGHQVVTSTTRPASPTIGQIIFETDTLSYRWYNGTAWEGVTPVGTIQPFAGATAPSGWLFCFGQTLNATTTPIYTDLYNVLGVTYGGSSISAFSVPDLRGRVVAGKDNMGGSTASRLTAGGSGITGTTLGANGGAETHTLITAQMPSHSHGGATGLGTGPLELTDGRNLVYTNAAAGTGTFGTTPGTSNLQVEPHTHPITAQGGGAAHNNTQPTIITNYIIKI
jgi:microcystin-dependent protein